MNNIDSGLGSIGRKVLSSLSQQGKEVFTVTDAQEVLGGSRNRVTKLLHDLEKKKWLYRLEKGKYSLIPLSAGLEGEYSTQPLLVAAKLVSPYYIGYWTALNFYELTEQLTRTVFIAISKRKKDLEIKGVKYQFVYQPESKLFGVESKWVEHHQVLFSDKEKTIIDCLDRPKYASGIVEVAKALSNAFADLNQDKLFDYALRMENGAVIKRLGFILEALNLGSRVFLAALKSKVSKGYPLLEPILPRKGRYNNKWGLMVNIDVEELTNWRAH